MKKNITLSEGELVCVLSALEVIVVSLEKIGQSAPDRDRPQKLYRFVETSEIYGQLAAARRSLWEACDKQLSVSLLSKLEDQLASVSYWRAEPNQQVNPTSRPKHGEDHRAKK